MAKTAMFFKEREMNVLYEHLDVANPAAMRLLLGTLEDSFPSAIMGTVNLVVTVLVPVTPKEGSAS